MPNSDKVDSISFEAAASPDAERIAPLALYFSTGHSRLDHSKCQWELHTAARDAAEHYVVGRLVSQFDLLSEGPKLHFGLNISTTVCNGNV